MASQGKTEKVSIGKALKAFRSRYGQTKQNNLILLPFSMH